MLKAEYYLYIFPNPALIPDPIKNLTATVDMLKLSVTLNWNPPANATDAGNITKYRICFWDEEKGCCSEKSVNGSVTTTDITRESGLRPWTMFTFKVTAYSGSNASQEGRTISRYIGMQTCYPTYIPLTYVWPHDCYVCVHMTVMCASV